MRRRTAFIFFGVLMLLGAGFYTFVNGGFYPTAIVNARMVSSRVFEKELNANFQYYSKTALDEATKNQVAGAEFLIELRRATLDDLIEKELIEQAVEEMVGKDLSVVLDNKLASVDLQSANLPEALRSLYGLSLNDFNELVLVPQAKREILEGKLTEQGKGDLEKLLTERRQNAKVHVLNSGMSWENGEVKIK